MKIKYFFNLKTVFLIYTRLFDPFVVICAAYLLVFVKFAAFPKDLKLFFFVLFVNIIIPVFYFINLLKQKKVGNWDITNKNERRKLLGPLIIFIIIGTLLILIFSDKSQKITFYLLRIQFAGILLFSYLFLISPFFKSSGHVGTMSVFFPLLLKMFNYASLWFLILILVQGVSRVYLKKHTFPEVLAGFISGVIIGLTAFFL